MNKSNEVFLRKNQFLNHAKSKLPLCIYEFKYLKQFRYQMYINILLRPLCWWVSLALRLKLRFSEVGRAEMEKTILVSIFLCIYGRLQIMQNDYQYYTRIEVRLVVVNHIFCQICKVPFQSIFSIYKTMDYLGAIPQYFLVFQIYSKHQINLKTFQIL